MRAVWLALPLKRDPEGAEGRISVGVQYCIQIIKKAEVLTRRQDGLCMEGRTTDADEGRTR